jgi:outer membrane lipoprotein-sorting protein
MSVLRRIAVAASLVLPFTLSGCFLLFTTRHLPIPKAPSVVLSATPQQLVDLLNQRWDALQTLDAKVEIQTSVLKTKEGVAKDYTTFPAIVMIRKPELLRVYGRVPVIGTEMFDMASDGKNFTLYIPSKNKAIEGANSLKKKSANAIENMRPGFFLDAMVVRGLQPGDDYSVAADSETVEDSSKKHLLLTPEYVLSIMRPKPGSHELTPVRVVTFHRSDLLPSEQDLYDSEGTLETHVTYRDYRDFGFGLYPSTIVIRCPQEEYQIVITVEKVTQNMTLNDDQFVVKVPEGTIIQHLE